MLTLEQVYSISQSLSSLGVEWSLGPLVLFQAITSNLTGDIDLAVHVEDISDRLIETCKALNIKNIFAVINRGFSARCIYVWGLPCISIEDVLLSLWHELNRPYREIITSLVRRISLDDIDWSYVRNVALRLRVLDKVRETLRELGLDRGYL